MNINESELIEYLGKISSKISSVDNEIELISVLSEIIDELLDVKYTAIYLWSPEENKLKLLTAKGFTEEDKINAEKSVMERHPGWVFKNQELFHVPDTRLDKGSISKTGKRSFNVLSRLFIPVVHMESSLGTIGFASEEANFFQSRHINVLRFIANITGAVYSSIILKRAERRNNEKLQIAFEETQQEKEKQQAFFAKMNHELRTPLNAIIGMSDLLKNSELNQQQAKYLNAISLSSNSLLRLINDILDLSKIKSDKFSLEKTEVNFQTIVSEVLESLSHTAKEKGILLKKKINSDLPSLLGDPYRLKQVITNLVSNSIKFTEKGSVSISVEMISNIEDNYQIKVSVEDTGKGIKPDRINSIFNSFQQEEDNTQRKFGGTGLGLSIANEILENYDTSLRVESELNVGSKFYFTLSLETYNGGEVKIKQLNEFDLSNLNVLVAEDNEVNQFYAETVLNNFGCNISIVSNGQDAFKVMKDGAYDIVLMDMQMPIMDGVAATKKIRNELDTSVKIIGLSANTVQDDIESCINAGMNSFLAKPYTPSQLNNEIGQLLNLQPINKPRPNCNSSSTNGSYNLNKVEKMLNESPEFVNKIIELFSNHTIDDLNRLDKCLGKHEFSEILEITHKLKPNYQLFEINKGLTLLSEIESTTNVEYIRDRLDHLKSITKNVIEDLKTAMK